MIEVISAPIVTINYYQRTAYLFKLYNPTHLTSTMISNIIKQLFVMEYYMTIDSIKNDFNTLLK